eukprot:Skav224487  [mRNA]  locus=scaffold2179:98145:99512:+ [translate_table: standard]
MVTVKGVFIVSQGLVAEKNPDDSSVKPSYPASSSGSGAQSFETLSARIADLEAENLKLMTNVKKNKDAILDFKRMLKDTIINVNVRMLSGRSFVVQTKNGKTVSQFKKQDLSSHVEGDDVMFHLVVNGQVLQNNKRLHTYGVINGSFIDYVRRHVEGVVQQPSESIIRSADGAQQDSDDGSSGGSEKSEPTIIEMNEHDMDTNYGKVDVFITNGNRETKIFRYYYQREDQFQVIFDALARYDVFVSNDGELMLFNKNNPASKVVSYESISSWTSPTMTHVDLIVKVGAVGGGKRGLGGGYKMDKEQKLKLLSDHLALLHAKVGTSQTTHVQDVWRIINQVKDGVQNNPSSVCATAMTAFDVPTLQKIQSQLFHSNLDFKLTFLTKVFYGEMWKRIDDAKTDYAMTEDAMKTALHSMFLAECSVSDGPIVSWQVLSDKVVSMVAQKSATAPADAPM